MSGTGPRPALTGLKPHSKSSKPNLLIWGGSDNVSWMDSGGLYTPLPQQVTVDASDINRDAWVDGLDLSQLGHAFGCASGDACFASGPDIKRDGSVDGQDLAALLSVFGRNFCQLPPIPEALPEAPIEKFLPPKHGQGQSILSNMDITYQIIAPQGPRPLSPARVF